MEISPANSNIFGDDEAETVSAFNSLLPSDAQQKKAISDVFAKVTITDNFSLPTSKMDPSTTVQMTAMDGAAESDQSTLSVNASQLMKALSTGAASIEAGSTSERLIINIDGQRYVVVGNFAHTVLSGALEVAGYFGTYQLTSAVVDGDLILLDDDENPVVVVDLDGAEKE